MYETQKKRRIRRPAAWLLAVLLTGALCCQTVWADQRTLIPVGKAVGIKLFADGVLVVSTASDGPCPARDCGIQEGDLIVSCNGERITSAEELQALLQAAGGTPAAVGPAPGRQKPYRHRRAGAGGGWLLASGRLDTGLYGGRGDSDLL